MSLAKEVKVGKTTLHVPVTMVDQLVNYFNPAAGRTRYYERIRLAMSGGYSGADKRRRANQKGGMPEMSADSAILPDLPTLREESQNLHRNNAIAAGALNTNVTKVVGTGLSVKAQIDRNLLLLDDKKADQWERDAEREFRLATETREIDSERHFSFKLYQGLAFLKTLEDGDTLINMPRFRRPGSPYTLKLQMIEAARLCNPNFSPDTEKIAGGVEKDQYGASEKFHVLNQHPGNARMMFLAKTKEQFSWGHLNAFDKSGNPLVLHLFDKKRPLQTRGVPYLAPVVELIKQLGRYTDAEVMAAVVSGMLTVFVTNEQGLPDLNPAPTEENPEGDPSKQIDTTGLELGYGNVVGLLPGEQVQSPTPGRPNTAFDGFLLSISKQIGMALELPVEVLFKQFNASYSASKAAFEEAWAYFRRRRTWLVEMLCQPVYEAIITEAVATGRLGAPGFFADPLIRKAWLGTLWSGDAPAQLDPKKEIDAAVARIDARLTSRSEERTRLVGGDWESSLPAMIREEKLLKDADMLPPPKTQQPAQPSQEDNNQ